MHHLDELTAFQGVYSLVASLDPACGRFLRLVTGCCGCRLRLNVR